MVTNYKSIETLNLYYVFVMNISRYDKKLSVGIYINTISIQRVQGWQ